MPEIAEISRACHYLRKHLAGRKIASVQALEDAKIFATAKTGLTKARLESALTGRTVVDARQQGKYFWLVLDQAPHLLCHFGMTGWFKFSHDESAYYRPQKERDNEDAASEWPPRFWKLLLKMDGDPEVEAAFIDARRFGKLMLIDAAADDMRKTSPLKENGPDPVQDKEFVTVTWLKEKLQRKRIPVKALLLDQAVLSGVGNWVADEVLYQARIHPEQYSNTFSDAQVEALHKNLLYVCQTACDLLADSDQFPGHWLMRYRWGKGKVDENTLPNGEKIKHITVGGRTSAIVPSVQRKTGPVAGGDSFDASENDDEGADNGPTLAKGKRIASKKKTDGTTAKPGRDAELNGKRKARDQVKEESVEQGPQQDTGQRRSSRHAAAASVAGPKVSPSPVKEETGTRKRRKA